MLLEATALARAGGVATDVCVVGAGVAGLSIARKLAGSGLRVCVVEAGSGTAPAEAPFACEGEARGTLIADGRRYLTHSRMRALGGSTLLWGGWCRPLDGTDFARREWVPDSGWPFSAEALRPHYDRACQILKVPPLREWSWQAAEGSRRRAAADHSGASGPALETALLFRSGVRSLWAEGESEWRDSSLIRVISGATIDRLGVDGGGRSVQWASASTRTGGALAIRARAFVLAAGGIENTRLLLSSPVAGRSEALGRYFMDHPHLPVACVTFHDRAAGLAYAGWHRPGGRGALRRAALVLPARVQRELAVLNCSFTLVPLPPPSERREDTVRAFVDRCSEHFYPSVDEPAGPLRDCERLFRRYERHLQRARGSAPQGSPCEAEPLHGILFARAEQSPRASNRISAEGGYGAQGRVHVEWRLGDLDHRTLLASSLWVTRRLERLGVARADLLIGDSDAMMFGGGGCHHMGGTRMHADPRLGVVDADCQVHGLTNLFVAGSSVFPTGGWANPTLTLVALADRLADHLCRVLGRKVLALHHHRAAAELDVHRTPVPGSPPSAYVDAA